MIVERDLMAVARDGVRLATDVYRPEGTGPFPVILERTPYDKAAPSRSEITAADMKPRSREAVARYFVEAGYAVAYQDCRGRYHSEGSFTKYLSEAADGFDTCAWLVAQPWCNGRVATMGLSYAAHAQMALGCLDPPGLAAQYLDCGGFSNAYRSGIRHGGAFDLKQATWAYRNALADARDPEVKAALETEDIAAWMARMPWRRGDSPLRAAPEYEDYLFEQWSHGIFDDFWKQPGLYAEGYYDRYADVPTVHLSGWYDPYARTAMENYAGLAARRRGPARLILGPWTHGDRSLSFAGDVAFGPDATLDGLAEDFFAARRRWFDCWVKGIDNGVAREPAVRVFVMGGGRMGDGVGRRDADGRLDHGGFWREAASWPLPQTEFTRFHLHPGRSLLVAKPGDGGAPLTVAADPRDPVPTIGGALSSGGPVMYSGAYEQRTGSGIFGAKPPFGPLAERPDVLVFQTPPLPEDLEIAGPLELHLWVASDGPDADIHAKLVDLYPPSADYPDGFAMNLSEGLLRLRYRASWEAPALLEPGRPYAVTVAMFPCANLFTRGHRLRLDLAGSNFPHFDVNPNSGEPEGSMERPRRAATRIFVDAARPSHLVLPVIRGR
ncbi:MAG TPA: CocE/NonD family hydrolase [Stellaceae bacterium]|nr:CocE/NonD family hydrolase [Stellaceae bacterium]